MNGHRPPADPAPRREARPAAAPAAGPASADRARRQAAARRARGADPRPLPDHLRGDLGGRAGRAAAARDRQEAEQDAARLDVQPGPGPLRRRAAAGQDRVGQHLRPDRRPRRRARLTSTRPSSCSRTCTTTSISASAPGNLRNIRRLRDVAPRPARHVQDDRAGLAGHEDSARALQGRRRGRVRHAAVERLQRACSTGSSRT